jgi:hypothetical protein
VSAPDQLWVFFFVVLGKEGELTLLLSDSRADSDGL